MNTEVTVLVVRTGTSYVLVRRYQVGDKVVFYPATLLKLVANSSVYSSYSLGHCYLLLLLRPW